MSWGGLWGLKLLPMGLLTQVHAGLPGFMSCFQEDKSVEVLKNIRQAFSTGSQAQWGSLARTQSIQLL